MQLQVISFVTQKGGSGKSTSCASLAVAAWEQGRRVFVLELDRQGTLSDWADNRKSDEGPDFEQIDASALEQSLATLKDAKYDIVLIDTPGVDSPGVNAAMRVSDFALIPCRPTAPDLRGCMPTTQALIRLGKPFAFLLSQCPPRSPRSDEARAGLAAMGLIAEPGLVSRADHQDAMAAGMGVTEFNPDGPAASEIRQLWSWVEHKIQPKGKKHVKTA
jgi:chromosome partitioning protein